MTTAIQTEEAIKSTPIIIEGQLVSDQFLLPEEDGAIVDNFQEHPQSVILTDALQPILDKLHPDKRYAIGQDSGIYWRRDLEEPMRGVIAPDWFYVPNARSLPTGTYRRSYIMWEEVIPPVIVLEFASGNGEKERDNTPYEGKFWIYEQVIRSAFYGIFEIKTGAFELYRFDGIAYQQLLPNEAGHYFIDALGVSLGIWHGTYLDMTLDWLRWFNAEGQLLPLGNERAEVERQRAEMEKQRAEVEKQRAEMERQRAEVEKQRADQEMQRANEAEQRAATLAAKLRAMGIDPNKL